MSAQSGQQCIQSPKNASIDSLLSRYMKVREFSQVLAKPLSAEDCAIQTMPDVSPTRWHLAHTTWFFETFVLKNADSSYRSFDDTFEYLFNSYYNSVGSQFPRHRRGEISRPGLAATMDYRSHVDEHIVRLLREGAIDSRSTETIVLGLHHEQQHQELMLTDIKHVLFSNPTFPAYQSPARVGPQISSAATDGSLVRPSWVDVDERLVEVGFSSEHLPADTAHANHFSFDNETPRHQTFLQNHKLATRTVSNAEFLEFVEDDGYARPELWLSLGWAEVNQNRWCSPLYWVKRNGAWFEYTLNGLRPIRYDEPVCHLSYFEADAFARWAGSRLPTEFEWEASAPETAPGGCFADRLLDQNLPLHPTRSLDQSGANDDLQDLFGSVWEWTSSPYTAYPGFEPAVGALGEYNGKFMCNQFVLRGGSCATSSDHIRPTYRNFFPPNARWQFTGLRLAR